MTFVSSRLHARRPCVARRAFLAVMSCGMLAIPMERAWAAGAPVGAIDRAAHGEALYQRALRMLDRKSFEGRRAAIADLEQATLDAPDNPGFQLTLARGPSNITPTLTQSV